MRVWKRARRVLPLHILMVSLVLFIGRVTAQAQPIIRLEMPAAALTTGETYEVAIRIENAPQFWALDVTLEYDPSRLYIMGTKAGSPIKAGELFSGTTAIVVKLPRRRAAA